MPAFRYLPLWPFDSVANAIAWQKEALPGGHQPWHLNAGETALTFTAYLGFASMDRVITTTSGDQAWVGVGYRSESGRDMVAAILHLARIGQGPIRTGHGRLSAAANPR